MNSIKRFSTALEISMEIDKLLSERKKSEIKYKIDEQIELKLKELEKLNKIPYWFEGIYSNK